MKYTNVDFSFLYAQLPFFIHIATQSEPTRPPLRWPAALIPHMPIMQLRLVTPTFHPLITYHPRLVFRAPICFSFPFGTCYPIYIRFIHIYTHPTDNILLEGRLLSLEPELGNDKQCRLLKGMQLVSNLAIQSELV